MPDLETMDRNQKAVLWAAVDESFDEHGEQKIAAPVELDVRWVWKSKLMAGPNGDPVTVDATAVVAQEVSIGSTMWQGELADWYGTGSAGGDDAVMEVVAFSETSDILHRRFRRTVGLKFYKDALPPSA